MVNPVSRVEPPYDKSQEPKKDTTYHVVGSGFEGIFSKKLDDAKKEKVEEIRPGVYAIGDAIVYIGGSKR